MLKLLKRWWLKVQLKELDEAYSYNYFMHGYYKDEQRQFEVKRRALCIKIASLT